MWSDDQMDGFGKWVKDDFIYEGYFKLGKRSG